VLLVADELRKLLIRSRRRRAGAPVGVAAVRRAGSELALGVEA